MDEISNYDVVTFTNVSDATFVGMYGGKEVSFEPHKVTQLPRFLADHYANQLAIKILMGQGKDWGNDSKLKADLVSEILGSVTVSNKEIKEVEKVMKEFEDLEEETKVESGIPCPICGKLSKTEAATKAHITRMHKTEQTN